MTVSSPWLRTLLAVSAAGGLTLAAAGTLMAQSPAQTGAAAQEPAPAEPAPAAEPPSDAAEATEAPATAAEIAEAERRALAELEASMSISTERVEALKREIEDMRGDRDRQNAALIAAAQRVRAAEAEVSAMEDRLGELIVAELEVRGRLE